MINEINGDFLQWLRGFYYTAQQESVSKAAEHMGRGQSTISHHIACLEQEMGVQLFERAHGRMYLTAEGRRLRDRAIELFETIQEMREDLNPFGPELAGRVAIATTHAILLYFLPIHIVEFLTAHPQVKFELDGGGLSRIMARVETGDSDFGIASLENTPPSLNFTPLFKTRPVLISPLKNPWNLVESFCLETIARCPFIAFPDSSTITEVVKRRFAAEGLKLNVIQVLNNFELVKKYVELGLGIAVLDEYALQPEDEQRLLVWPLERFLSERSYGILTRRRGYAPPAVRAFMQCIRGLAPRSAPR